MTPEELADLLYQALLGGQRRPVRRRGPPGREPLRRHGAGPAGGRDLLPLPHPAEPRPRRRARAADGRGARQALNDEAAGGEPPDLTGLEERLLRDEFQARIDQLRRGDRERDPPTPGGRPGQRGPGQVVAQAPARGHRRHARHPRRVGGPAQGPRTRCRRKLAVRLARKRRHGRKGPLDFRSTVRHSLSTGGVPVDPKFRYPRPSKPEILVIADISGSVATLRPLHPAPGPRHQLAVLQGAQLRVHRRHRRGDAGSSRGSTTRPTPCTGSTPRPT